MFGIPTDENPLPIRSGNLATRFKIAEGGNNKLVVQRPGDGPSAESAIQPGRQVLTSGTE